MRKRILFILMMSILLGFPEKAFGATTDNPKTREYVWTLKAYDGEQYFGVFAPATARDIYIFANTRNLFSFKETYVYYWDLDREYKADWENLNHQITGTVKVSTINGNNIATLEMVQTVLDISDPTNGMQDLLFEGDAADKQYNDYLKQRSAYFELIKQYDQKLADYFKAIQEGKKPAAVEQPAPFTRMMSEPGLNFVINLPAGTYRILFYDENGNAIPQSERLIHSIAPRREGIGYEIIPLSRWTNAEKSETIDDIIYSSTETTYYIKPYVSYEYNDLELSRLENPQNKSASNKNWIWKYDHPLEDRELKVDDPQGKSELIQPGDYRVVQTSGSALGYTVEPYLPQAEDASPDITGYEVVIADQSDINFFLVDKQGNAIPGSMRKIIFVENTLPAPIYIVAALPLLLSEVIQLRKRILKKRVKKLLASSS